MMEHIPVGADKLFAVENDFSHSPLVDREGDIATALISAEAQQQELEVKRYKKLVFEVLNKHRRVTFLQNSPENSAVYSYCAKQKHIAKEIMARKGVAVPEGGVFTDIETAWEYVEALNSAVVIKPVDRAYGTGVTTDVRGREHFESAWDYASGYSKEVLVERFIPGYDLRVIVVGEKAVAACARIPANVVGDGQSTIQELVEQKNLQRERNPSLQTDMIKRFDLLEKSGRLLTDVPAAGEHIQLTSVANVSAGGDAVQLIDLVPAKVLEIAERAASCFPGLAQVGVDLMVNDRGPEVEARVIEINSNPGISDAVFPSYGRPVNVPEELLRFVFNRAEPETRDDSGDRLVPADPYAFAPRVRAPSREESEQAGYITQAAYTANLSVEHISPYIYRVGSGDESVMFYQGMPDRTNVISRKVSRDRKWLHELLAQAGLYDPAVTDGPTELCQYRLIVIDGRVVAGIDGGLYTGGKGGVSRYLEQRRDITESIHPEFVGAAIRAVGAAFKPYFAGVDILAEDIESAPGQQSWQVSDVMCNPNLSIHHFPTEGVGRDIASALLRSLFPNADRGGAPVRCIYAIVSGRVQGVGYRDWIQCLAVRHGVSGWVRNLPHGDVEIFLEGHAKAIDELLALAEQGPPRARVAAVTARDCPLTEQRAFLVYR